jgi:hypothetical protein
MFSYAIAHSLKGSSTPAYKGARRGHYGGSGAGTTCSSRLSPIQCRMLHGNPPWAYLGDPP